MAERYSITVSCVVPLTYKCTKCGSISGAAIPLSETYTKSYSIFGGSRTNQKNETKCAAIAEMKDRVSAIYNNEPLKCGHSIIGVCASCGHREVWQTSNKKHSSDSILGSILGLLIVFACIIIPILLAQLFLIPVFMIGALFLIVKCSELSKKIQSRVPSKNEQKKQQILSSLPHENRPVYTLSRNQMLDKIK